jgi:iron complex transport system permease protein
MRRAWFTVLLMLAAPLSLLCALRFGSLDTDWATVWQVLSGGGPELAASAILELRLPRAIAAFAVGGMLALAGALLQVLLRNPLADPYILGISGGAAVAALAALLLGLSSLWVNAGALAGALLSMFLVFGVSRAGGLWTSNRLLLTGVVIAAGWGALISLLLALAPAAPLAGMIFWLLGDLGYSRTPALGVLVLAAGLAVAYLFARPLNLLARGETVAATLGENPARLRFTIYFLASLLTAVAVTLAGSIGFIGLIVPHLLRLVAGTDHRWLLPNAVLLGGSFLTVADTLARNVVAPLQLPVGVLTALLGVPVFLYLLARTRG